MNNLKSNLVRFIERRHNIELTDKERLIADKYYKLVRGGRIDLKSYTENDIRKYLQESNYTGMTNKDIKIISKTLSFNFVYYNKFNREGDIYLDDKNEETEKEIKKHYNLPFRNDIYVNFIVRGFNNSPAGRTERIIKGLFNEKNTSENKNFQDLIPLEDDYDFYKNINNRYKPVNDKTLYKQLSFFSPIDFIDNNDKLTEHKTIAGFKHIDYYKKEDKEGDILFDNLSKLIFNKLVSDKSLRIIFQDRYDRYVEYDFDFKFKNKKRKKKFEDYKNNLKYNPVMKNDYNNDKFLTNLFRKELTSQNFRTSLREYKYNEAESNNIYIHIPFNKTIEYDYVKTEEIDLEEKKED